MLYLINIKTFLWLAHLSITKYFVKSSIIKYLNIYHNQDNAYIQNQNFKTQSPMLQLISITIHIYNIKMNFQRNEEIQCLYTLAMKNQSCIQNRPSYWDLLSTEPLEGLYGRLLQDAPLKLRSRSTISARHVRSPKGCRARLRPWLLPLVWGVKSRGRSSNTNPSMPSCGKCYGVNASDWRTHDRKGAGDDRISHLKTLFIKNASEFKISWAACGIRVPQYATIAR